VRAKTEKVNMTNLYLVVDNQPKIKNVTNNISHIDETIFNDNDIKKVFQNAINKKAFTWEQVKDPNNYIMYMCSNNKYDYFKSKLTKTSYKTKR